MNSIPKVGSSERYNEMLPQYDKPVYKQCTQCGAPIQLTDSQSPESREGTLWSDAYFEVHDSPEPQLLGKCGACGAVGCLAELPAMKDATPLAGGTDHTIEPLTVDDYAVLVDNLETISAQFHSYLRIRFWQLSNDRRRGVEVPLPLTAVERANLVELLKLLGEAPADRLMKAQGLRQLEDFAGAEAVLTQPFDAQLSPIIERLRRLGREREVRLVKIFSGDLRQAASLLSI